jgi:2,3-bisphosphoglycerate-independent phosphoglycerate mutase
MIESNRAMSDTPASTILPRKQGEARRVAATAYEFRGCVICGLSLQSGIMVASYEI